MRIAQAAFAPTDTRLKVPSGAPEETFQHSRDWSIRIAHAPLPTSSEAKGPGGGVADSFPIAFQHLIVPSCRMTHVSSNPADTSRTTSTPAAPGAGSAAATRGVTARDTAQSTAIKTAVADRERRP